MRPSGHSGPIGMSSNVIISARPSGRSSSSLGASAGSVTFMRKTAPDPSLLANHWSIFPANCGSDPARAVARILVVDYQRSGGQSQRSALLAMNPKSDRIQNALAYARRNLRRPFLRVFGQSPQALRRMALGQQAVDVS